MILVFLLTGCGSKEPDMTIEVIVTKIEETQEITTKQAEKESLSEAPLPEASHQEEPKAIENSSEEIQEAEVGIRKLLQTAMLPVGSTMYIWGGGWNEEDTGAGVGATTIGLYPEWETFAAAQSADYNMKEHRYEILKGLDCSGYIGWLVYNMFETEDGQQGYVYKSTDTAWAYSELGWGDYMEAPSAFLPGDVVSMKGHVWLSLGSCADGSVLLLHSSPPGVSLCGTLLADGSESEAVRLAREYMTMNYPEWQKKYPARGVSHSYLDAVGLLRWKEEVMPGAEAYRLLKAEEVLAEIG